MGNLRRMRVVVAAVVLLACLVHAVPEETSSAVGDLLSLVQEEKSHQEQESATYSDEEFAGLMNAIIMKASKMRVVMNKLGISDTDSVKTVEKHFIRLGKEHTDLGEGMENEEELRLRGLQARSCVKHATSCSRDAASCHGPIGECAQVVKGCTQAAASCGVRRLGEAKDDKKDAANAKKDTANAKKAAANAKKAPKAKVEKAQPAPEKKAKPVAPAVAKPNVKKQSKPQAKAEKKTPTQEEVEKLVSNTLEDTMSAETSLDDRLTLLQMDLEDEIEARSSHSDF